MSGESLSKTASNTSPILRLSVEAKDQKRLNELEKKMKKLINNFASVVSQSIY
jgi:phosphomannomutase